MAKKKKLKVYVYEKCSTCRNAVKWLERKGIAFDVLPIRETPPSKAELKRMVGSYDGEVRRILNTSSKDYREANLKERLATMSTSDVFALLQTNGNLVKRPFVLGDGFGLVGFKEEQWRETLRR